MVKHLQLEKIDELKSLDDDGTDSVLKELIAIYLSSTPAKLKKMYELYCLRDLKNLKNEAHSLRSSSIALGGAVVAGTAQEIEYFNDKIPQADEVMRSLILRLMQEFKELETALKPFQ